MKKKETSRSGLYMIGSVPCRILYKPYEEQTIMICSETTKEKRVYRNSEKFYYNYDY